MSGGKWSIGKAAFGGGLFAMLQVSAPAQSEEDYRPILAVEVNRIIVQPCAEETVASHYAWEDYSDEELDDRFYMILSELSAPGLAERLNHYFVRSPERWNERGAIYARLRSACIRDPWGPWQEYL